MILRVLEVISDREVAVSGGSTGGLEEGDTLRILSEPIKILDGDEVVGEVVRTKGYVRVYDVRPRFALARTFRNKRVNVGGQGVGVLGRMFEAPKYETRHETLERDPSKDEDIDPTDSIVEVGDPVEKVEGNVSDLPSFTVWK